MSKSIISEGKTTNEAIENGLKKLKVSMDMVDVKVLEDEEKRSFFSILAPRVVKVELTLKENHNKKGERPEHREKRQIQNTKQELEKAKENIDKFLKDLSEKMPAIAEYETTILENIVEVKIDGKDVGFLIGYRGETLYAFQNILSAIANRGITNRVRILLDISGYKEKRTKTLEELAEKIARTVEKTRKSVTLEPMQPYERKIIHSKLQGNDKISTKSIGEEPRRRVIISLSK